jgi:DNA-binding transcriptional LysR family regulator
MAIMIEQRHLRQVLAIAKHGSFRKAAETLHMSQPALSKSILKLEDRLGIQLLNRETRPVRPTVYGRLFLERARLATSIVEDLDEKLQQLAGLQTGLVRIGLSRIGAHTLVGRAVALFAVRHPELRLILGQFSPEETMARFERLELDIVVVDEDSHTIKDWCQWKDLGAVPLVFVVRAGHPLLREATPTLSETLRYPLILDRIPLWGLSWIEATLACEQQRVPERPLPWLTCDNYCVIHQVLLATDHFSIGPVDAFQPLLDAGALATLALKGIGPSWQPLVAYHGRQPASPAVEAFLECLMESRGLPWPCQSDDDSPP